jgi:hypothetical protein
MADLAFQWVDADGGVWDIENGSDITLLYGMKGRFAPVTGLVVQPLPSLPGQRFTDVKHAAAGVVVPVDFYGASDAGLRTSIRNWTYRLNPTRGDGRLRVTAPGGDQRELVCRYRAGLENMVEDTRTLGYRQIAVLDFTAEQPYWQDTADTSQSYNLLTTLATFFPFFPLRLSGSEIFAAPTVVNTGDVPTWPVWVITGPGSNPVLRNLTTGLSLSLTVTLAAGEYVVIDTRPFTASTPNGGTIFKNDGTNLFGQMSTLSQFWPLIVGSNTLSLEMTGAVANVSQMQLNFRRDFLST